METDVGSRAAQGWLAGLTRAPLHQRSSTAVLQLIARPMSLEQRQSQALFVPTRPTSSPAQAEPHKLGVLIWGKTRALPRLHEIRGEDPQC